VALIELPALGALDVVLAAVSETAMVLCPLRREDVLTAAAAAPPVPVTAAAAPPVPVTAAAGAVGAAPRPLCLRGNVVVVATAKTPLLGRLRAASKLAFLFPLLVGMATRINAELLMMAQNGRMREW
jgi:hypothetical protein